MEVPEIVFSALSPDQVSPVCESVILLQLLPVSVPVPISLDEEEQLKAKRFVHTDDRDRFIIRRSSLRNFLSLWTGKSPESIRYLRGHHGKPEFPGLPFRFNMSHTKGAVVYYFGPDIAGIDIEEIQPSRRFAELEQTQLHPEEKSLCQTDLDFFTIWTRKEAVLKADGRGITESLSNLNTAHTHLDYYGVRYSVSTWQSGNKVISLAVSGKKTVEPRFLLI